MADILGVKNLHAHFYFSLKLQTSDHKLGKILSLCPLKIFFALVWLLASHQEPIRRHYSQSHGF